MKRILLGFVLIGTLSALSAQESDREIYSRAVFTMNDGSEKPVLFYRYTYPTQSLYTYIEGSDTHISNISLKQKVKY